jgi:RNA polymerase sigma-70 factor (ECF subfamily)
MCTVSVNPAALTVVEEVYRADSRRVLATLIRLLGDFERAEEAMHDAFRAAIETWPKSGVPENPRAWLVSTGRFKAIDAYRRQARMDASLTELAYRWERESVSPPDTDSDINSDPCVEDDQLRLIFTCCHPALPPDARVAMALREICGLKTEEVARAFLTGPPTIAKRIVRAKAKIRDAGIPYEIPSREELPERLESVLQVIYLIFTEGYSASAGDSLTRPDLSGEAIRLGRLLTGLLSHPEAEGLLALLLLQESRRAARSSPQGEIVLLDEQDRSLWDQALIADGAVHLSSALASPTPGPYALQAAIAAVHAQAATAAATDWAKIVELYDTLLLLSPSPVIALNRAVAVSMVQGPLAGLALIDELPANELADFYPVHVARADLCRRLGRTRESCSHYARALQLAQQQPVRLFLTRRLQELQARVPSPQVP